MFLQDFYFLPVDLHGQLLTCLINVPVLHHFHVKSSRRAGEHVIEGRIHGVITLESGTYSKNKLAKLKYLPNSFEIIEQGDHVICAMTGKKIFLDELNYWNVELQEPYFSFIEAQQKREELERKD